MKLHGSERRAVPGRPRPRAVEAWPPRALGQRCPAQVRGRGASAGNHWRGAAPSGVRDASPIAPPTATIDDVLAELAKHRAEIDERLSRTDAATRSHLEDELARQLACSRTESSPVQNFVLNPRSECMHRAASHGTAVPPTAWRTRCGWRFAFSAHSLTTDLKGIMWWQVCGICCPAERAASRLNPALPGS